MKTLIQLSWALCLSLLLSSNSWVFADDNPQQQVEQTTERLLAKLRDNKDAYQQNPELLYDMVNQEVLKHFDFERMSRLVLGKHWASASDAQKTAFVSEFKQLIVRTYALSVLKFTNQEVKFKPMSGDVAEKKVTVHSEVVDPDKGQRIPLAYSLYKPANDWLVYDVKVDHVSLVINYKSTYDQAINKDGLDALIASIKAKNAEQK
jgi:phospholipid transport system substrate-binding protein